jgi:hypothetical protein
MVKKRVMSGKGWNFDLSGRQKRCAAWLLGALSFAAWLLFSTPNTLDFIVRYSKNITMLGIPFSGVISGVSIGLILSCLEIVFIYLAVWKSNYFWIVVAIIGSLAVGGSIKWGEKSTQTTKIQRIEIANTDSLISQTRESIRDEKNLLIKINADIKRYENNQGYVPNRLLNKLEEITLRKTTKEKELKAFINDLDSLNKNQGVTAEFSEDAETNMIFTIFLAILVEVLLIGGTYLALIIYDSSLGIAGDHVIVQNDKHFISVDLLQEKPELLSQYGFNITSEKKGKPVLKVDTSEEIKKDFPGQFKTNVGFNFGEKKQGKIEVRKTVKNVPENEFLNDLKKRKKPSTLTVKNVFDGVQKNVFENDKKRSENDLKNVPENDLKNDLKNVFEKQFQGKSDPFILYCWQNWNKVSGEKRSYGKCAKIVSDVLPGKKTISKSYCFSVIKKAGGSSNA